MLVMICKDVFYHVLLSVQCPLCNISCWFRNNCQMSLRVTSVDHIYFCCSFRQHTLKVSWRERQQSRVKLKRASLIT